MLPKSTPVRASTSSDLVNCPCDTCRLSRSGGILGKSKRCRKSGVQVGSSRSWKDCLAGLECGSCVVRDDKTWSGLMPLLISHFVMDWKTSDQDCEWSTTNEPSSPTASTLLTVLIPDIPSTAKPLSSGSDSLKNAPAESKFNSLSPGRNSFPPCSYQVSLPIAACIAPLDSTSTLVESSFARSLMNAPTGPSPKVSGLAAALGLLDETDLAFQIPLMPGFYVLPHLMWKGLRHDHWKTHQGGHGLRPHQ